MSLEECKDFILELMNNCHVSDGHIYIRWDKKDYLATLLFNLVNKSKD